MAITNGYGTLASFKLRQDISDTGDDALIEGYIEAISRKIDELTWTRFHTTAADETRYYVAKDSEYLPIPDRIVSITTLKTDNDNDGTYENTWTVSTDYHLWPYNAALQSKPYYAIETAYNGNYSFPKNVRKGVQIVGKFGWTTAPLEIQEACYLGATRLMRRQDTPLGVSAAAAVGQLAVQVESLTTDPDFMALVAPFRAMV